jgi:hypothetical protein
VDRQIMQLEIERQRCKKKKTRPLKTGWQNWKKNWQTPVSARWN